MPRAASVVTVQYAWRGPGASKYSSEASTLEKVGVLIHDDRRFRSRFFDGRFLTAKDLTR